MTEAEKLAEEVVSAANIVSHDGYYELDLARVTEVLQAFISRLTAPAAVDVGARAERLTYALMRSGGRCDFRQLRIAVSEATSGVRSDPGIPEEMYPGHVMVAGINYNSLDRIVTAFVDAALQPRRAEAEWPECHGLDTPERVCFYEQDFYVLSNFSAFAIRWEDRQFPTSEHVYHWEKFKHLPGAMAIMFATSAHDAFKMAEQMKSIRRPDWDDVKVGIMRDILRAKANQHEYVRRKLLATGDRELVENSWRDDFWGWGPNRDGQNMLGKLWMEVRAELRAAPPRASEEG